MVGLSVRAPETGVLAVIAGVMVVAGAVMTAGLAETGAVMTGDPVAIGVAMTGVPVATAGVTIRGRVATVVRKEPSDRG